ncbi:MAG: hypothetical protein ACXWXS_11155, partial [Actinomycetota bacterium]
LVAVGGTIWAWVAEHSIALSIYVFCMLAFYVGRGLGDVVTDRSKVRRLVYFSLYPFFGTAILIGAYRLWEIWWLAVVLGFLGGVIVWALLGAWWFPDIEAEENADTDTRYREAREH